MWITGVLFFLLWLIVWIGGFNLIAVFFYKNKKYVDDLKSNLRECKSKLENLEEEVKEYKKQNEYLKNKMKEILQENNVLVEVVAKYNFYFENVREAVKHTKKLYELLKDFDEDFERKVKEILSKVDISKVVDEDEDDHQKRYF